MQCFMKEDESLIDVENVETTGVAICADKHHWTLHCIVYIHRNEAHFTYQCI